MVFTVFASLIVALFTQQSDTALIEGFVRTAVTDLPIAGVEVNAIGATPAVRVQGTTDGDGRFRLVVTPGQYQVFATKQGYSSPASRPLEPTPSTRITALAGQRTSANFQLLPTGTVTGRIFDPEGRPMEGVSVTLSRLSWTGDGRRMLQPISFGARGSATTNDLAEYRLYWIPVGDYYLSARDRSGTLTITGGSGVPQKYATTYYPGVADPNDAAPLHVPAGVELGGINLNLSRVHSTTVRGRVVSPVADVADSVTIVNMAPVDESIMSEPVPLNFNYVSKTFVADNILPGRYRIVATLRIPNKFNLSGEVTVTVGQEPLENVVVSVTPNQKITGQ
jgi:hypothetical protein